MKNSFNFLVAILVTASIHSVAKAQEKSEKGPWRKVHESAIPTVGKRYILPTTYLTFQLDVSKMQQQLGQAKRETDPAYVPVFIELPKPDGTFGTYRVYENTTMHPDLAAKLPAIRSFDGIPTDGSGEMVKLDFTPQGFHAMILSPSQPTMFIDPYTHGGGDIANYIIYSKADFVTDKRMECHVDELPLTTLKDKNEVDVVKSFGTCQKRTYRLALAATGEYTTFHGGTVLMAQAAQVTTMNRVNGVYTRDMAITMTIVGNNNLLIYTDNATDPYTNGDPGAMMGENQSNVTTVIGSSNYDIGHVFGTNSGGLAGLGVVCFNGFKAYGVTGSAAPIGDPFDIDYVAHEVGHQFSGNHTFRGNTGSCSGNANDATAMEPGSGTTIMAYAGICAPLNVQPNSNDHFHGVSLQEIGTFITSGGHTCPVITTIPSQSSPVISGTVGNVTIPANTPFALTAFATDADGDVLTYCWEQMNPENSTQPPVASSIDGPNFRSFSPSNSPTRYFPSISSLIAGGPFTWEVLPSVDRTMNFRVAVRDNEINGSCNDHEDITVTTTTAAGPFIVNYPSATGITWAGNTNQTVTWSVANTTAAPVSCANVDVIISLNGGATFTTLADDVPNDGSQIITVPNTATTTAIIMVMCANGTFFDVSNNVFTITAVTNDYTLSLDNSSVTACQGDDATILVNVGQIGTYADPVALSVTGLPGALTANFSPNPATPGASSTLLISNTAGVTPGNYPFTVEGNSTSGMHSVSGTLSISLGTPPTSTLVSPANGEPSAALPASLSWTNSGTGMTFDVQIATDAAFTNIVESATGLTATSYSATTLAPGTTYYWRVNSSNSCSSSGNSSVFSFTTSSCMTFSSTVVPVVISATGTPSVTSTITIPTGGIINDLNVVNLTGTHTYINDLTVMLKSPTGIISILWDGICDNENDFDVAFDDEATPGSLPCPPTDGNTYQSQNPLSVFDGLNMSGTWTLMIEDNSNNDGGSLTSWGLNICFTPAPACIPPDIPSITGSTFFCSGSSTTLTIGTGSLNAATNWYWYSGSCATTPAGTGTSINVSVPGTYFVRGYGGCVTSGGCQSVSITMQTVNVSTAVNAGVLSANQAGGSYQWLNCNNGNAPISGATSQSYTPTVSGSYAVIITAPNGCSDTSACINYSSVGIDEISDLAIQLYPNPTSGLVTVQFAQPVAITEINVTDVTGRIIRLQQNFTAETVQLDLSKESKGVYFLNVRVGTQLQTLKITKQ